MPLSASSLRAALRNPVLLWSSTFPLRHASLSEGLRAACGAGTMLLLGELLHNPLFSWAAIGAFLTCLADSAGSNRARLASMGGFALASTLAGMFAASLSSAGQAAGLLAIMACAGVAGFARIYGAACALVLTVAAGVSAILADFPLQLWPLRHSHVLIYFSGCAWATLLGLTVWRIHPFAPARQAVSRVYAALAELARLTAMHHEEAAASTRRHVRSDIDNAHTSLMRVDPERADARHVYEDLLIKLARADSLLSCITILGDLHLAGYQNTAMRRRIGRMLTGMALLLDDIGRNASDTNDQDARANMRLRQLLARMPLPVRQLLPMSENAVDKALQQAAAWKATPRAPAARYGFARNLRQLRAGLQELLRNAVAHLRAGSEEVRHGLRCAVAAGTTYTLVHLLALPFGYWATMATVLVMQPSIADSWKRSLERAGGSMVGGLLAVLLCLFIHSPLMLALLVFPLSALAMGLRPVSYGLYATFLTPVFVLVADVASDPQQQLSNAMLRAGNNVIGALIAIAASYLLWPRRQQVNLHQKLTQMILSNLDYLLAALHVADKLSPESGAQSPLQTQRRTTCVINNETGILLQRLVREQYIDQRQVHGARISVALSRRLAAAATHVWLHHAPADDAALLYWLKQVRQLFERALTESTAYPAILRQRPALPELARADAVETICLLVLAMYPELSAPTTPP